MKKLVVVLLALGLSGCAMNPNPTVRPDLAQTALATLPKNPDGSLDVQTLVKWAGDGINVVCDYDSHSPVCTIGMNAIQVIATKGQDPRAVLATVLAIEDQSPSLRAWLRWLSDTLTKWIAVFMTPTR